MAQFIGILQGQRGEVTRLGGKASGLRVVANGWDSGVKVRARTETDDYGNLVDVFVIEATGGSNGASPGQLIATIRNGVVENRMPQVEAIPGYCPDCGTKMDQANSFIGFVHGVNGVHCRSCIAEPIPVTHLYDPNRDGHGVCGAAGPTMSHHEIKRGRITCGPCLADATMPIVNNAHPCLCHCPTCGKGIDEANIRVDDSQSCLSCIA